MRNYFKSDRTFGIFLVSLASGMWGLTYPIWKVLSAKLPPLVLTSASFIIASMLIMLIDKQSPKALLEKFRANKLSLLILGLSAGALGTGLIFFALTKIDTGITSVLEKLQPIFTIIVARVFLKDLIPWNKIPLIVFSIFCATIISIGDPFQLSLDNLEIFGVLAAVGSSFFYGSNTVMCKLLLDKDITSKQLIFFRMFLGGLISSLVFIFPGNLNALFFIAVKILYITIYNILYNPSTYF